MRRREGGAEAPAESAERAGLRYVTNGEPGIARRRRGRGFSYHLPSGETIRDPAVRERIAALAIPPAWTDVWICRDALGHLQATGRDARGRKQYRYHPRWREVRDATKFDRMLAFAAALPRIRERVDADLRKRGLPREKVLAAVVLLLETTGIRIGSDEYSRTNGSYGLTTIRKRHVELGATAVRFSFRAKGGARQEVTVRNARVARVVRKCEELPGYELFGWRDEDGAARDVTSTDVNDYLAETAGERFTAKDFRTWWGSVHALSALLECGPARAKEAERNVVTAVDGVAANLRNTRAVCRKFYIHPGLLEAYVDGRLFRILEERRVRARKRMDVEEARLVRVLEGLSG